MGSRGVCLTLRSRDGFLGQVGTCEVGWERLESYFGKEIVKKSECNPGHTTKSSGLTLD